MQGGESGSEPMEVDVPDMGASISEVEMDIEGVHVMTEQRPTGEGVDSGSHVILVPSKLLSATLVTEVPVQGDRTSMAILVIRRDLGKDAVTVEEARDSSSSGEEMVGGEEAFTEVARPTVPVTHIFKGLVQSLGTGSVHDIEPSDPPLFPTVVGSSQARGPTLGDTLEEVRDEDLARTLQQDPSFADILTGERVTEHVQDVVF